ncbi:MAG: DUF6150 family protein [Pseudomonadota bacterium]
MTIVTEVENPHLADVTVEVVQSRGMADLLVHKSEGPAPTQHGEAQWCFVAGRVPAAKRVHFTKTPGLASLKICYVSSKALAGWLKNHKLKGRLA